MMVTLLPIQQCFPDHNRCRGIAQAFDGFIRVDETMVVVVDTHVFTENGAVSDADFLDGMHGATVVEEHIVADGDGSAQFSGAAVPYGNATPCPNGWICRK